VLKAYDKLGGTNLAQVQPRDPDRALQLIEPTCATSSVGTHGFRPR